jgi:hypothetical protein
MWFSFALVVLGALFDNLPTLQAYLDPQFYSYSLVVIGVCVAILRFITIQPLGKK